MPERFCGGNSLRRSAISSVCIFTFKDVVKHSNAGYKFIYVLLSLSSSVLIQKYLHVAGLSLSIDVLALFNITDGCLLCT